MKTVRSISDDFKLWMVNGLLIDEPQLNSLLYPEISRIGIKYNLTMKNIYQM